MCRRSVGAGGKGRSRLHSCAQRASVARDAMSTLEAERWAAPLVDGYRPLGGVYDEMVALDGAQRAHWQTLIG